MYDLVYIRDGKIIETIEVNKPKRICHWRKNQLLKNSPLTYSYGILVVKKNN